MDFPMKNCDFPVRYVSHYRRVFGTDFNHQTWRAATEYHTALSMLQSVPCLGLLQVSQLARTDQGSWPHFVLVGGWPTPPKNVSSSVGMMTFPIYGKIIQSCSRKTTNQIYETSLNPMKPPFSYSVPMVPVTTNQIFNVSVPSQHGGEVDWHLAAWIDGSFGGCLLVW